MVDQGADLIDVGGESTRPGSTRLDADTEWARIAPAVNELVAAHVPVSVDTVHAATAQRAIDAGVAVINDVSGGRADPRMLATVAGTDTDFVVQHWRGFPGAEGLDEAYPAGPAQILAETLTQVDAALSAGIAPERIIIDPGFGFAKDTETSWRLAADLERWVATGYRVLVGASRKRFIRSQWGSDVDRGTAEFTRMAHRVGVWAARVHDVAGSIQAAAEATGEQT